MSTNKPYYALQVFHTVTNQLSDFPFYSVIMPHSEMRPRSHQCDDMSMCVRARALLFSTGEAKYAAYACRVLLIRLLLAWFHAIVGRTAITYLSNLGWEWNGSFPLSLPCNQIACESSIWYLAQHHRRHQSKSLHAHR